MERNGAAEFEVAKIGAAIAECMPLHVPPAAQTLSPYSGGSALAYGYREPAAYAAPPTYAAPAVYAAPPTYAAPAAFVAPPTYAAPVTYAPPLGMWLLWQSVANNATQPAGAEVQTGTCSYVARIFTAT